MTRLIILVEGQTEEAFVREVLAPFLCNKGFHSIDARLFGNVRLRQGGGGVRTWESVRRDIVGHLKQDNQIYVTMMTDFYGLPSAWPGRSSADSVNMTQKATLVEASLFADIESNIDSKYRPERFIPFIIMHEYEALLFSDCAAFCRAIYKENILSKIRVIRDQFLSPEEINDSPVTAPSKRIKQIVPEYEKPLYGVLAALEIGLPKIMEECLHFKDWIERLITLVTTRNG